MLSFVNLIYNTSLLCILVLLHVTRWAGPLSGWDWVWGWGSCLTCICFSIPVQGREWIMGYQEEDHVTKNQACWGVSGNPMATGGDSGWECSSKEWEPNNKGQRMRPGWVYGRKSREGKSALCTAKKSTQLFGVQARAGNWSQECNFSLCFHFRKGQFSLPFQWEKPAGTWEDWELEQRGWRRWGEKGCRKNKTLKFSLGLWYNLGSQRLLGQPWS